MSTPLEAGLAAIAAAEATVLADLGAVLRVDTSYPPGENYAEIVAWAEARLAPLGFRCRRVEVPEVLWKVHGAGASGARVNLVAEQPGASGEAVGIYAHMDVVPAAEGWSVPPFAATRQGEWVLGRGAADMKASIAALMLALEAAHAHAVPLRYAPRVLLCTDEEGGAYPGIRYLAEQGEVPDHLLCLDGGAAPRIWSGAFGSLELLLEVEGMAGHAGQRGSGDNALERAIPILSGLLALKPVVEARVSALRDRVGEALRPILAITVAQAGVKANSIPDRCRIAMNRRTMPEEDDAAVLAEIEAAIAAAAPPGTRWALHVTGHLAATAGADEGPHWPRWTAAMAASFGWDASEARAYGASSSSDMGWVQRARPPGAPREILLGGAIRPDSRVHGVDERVRITDIQALAAAILRYLSGDFA
ncbi:M20/M25/M40 family metallo-hydrolase [Roseomonas sp. E05]|uniref:M20 family metallopeptidase n=1 Tax=Roseomonas sp. E05 TaxID=3046310 RepID=UPI0024BB0B8C|nr:M20/M25/M40 family metallo-hydrolase [Roseomonas sp. E05]MDJ0388545.1 M20/M25/M40 family metallo-hydrolase [Roseomonas sp. E05]